jgi:MFS family permease
MTPPTDRRSHSLDEQKVQQSLTACWKDGTAAQVMGSVVDTYTTPMALLLGANNVQIAALVAIPNLLASLTQLAAVGALTKAKSRLNWVVRGVAIQALMLVPLGFLTFLPGNWRINLLIVGITIYKVLNSAVSPAWGSLVSEYLPPQRRGDYFGWRSRILGITSISTIVVSGIILEFCEKLKADAYGFAILFSITAIARFISCYYLSKMMDLPTFSTKENHFTLWMFLKRFRESNFVKFVFYVSSMTFATNVAGPYFSVHMLRDLHFSYAGFMAVTLAPTLSGLIAFPLWGRQADQVGNARVLKLTGLMIPLIPILWLFAHTPAILFLVECGSGFVWGGFNLCAVNFIYDAVSPGKRIRCISYFNLINGLAIFSGAWLGGWLSAHVVPIFGYPLLGIFLVSAAMRLGSYLVLGEQFKEVRADVKHVPSLQLFFSIAGLQSYLGRATGFVGLNPWGRFSLRHRRASRTVPPANVPDAASPRSSNR